MKYKEVTRLELKRDIRDTKAANRRMIKRHFDSLDPRRACQGIQHITKNYSNNNIVTNNSTAPAEELNHFFGCHEQDITVTETMPATNTQALTLLRYNTPSVTSIYRTQQALMLSWDGF